MLMTVASATPARGGEVRARSGAGERSGALERYDAEIELLRSGLPPLSGLAHAGDQRLFLTALDGRILIWENGAIAEPPFLDLRPRVSTGRERGLLGLAFHPRHADNGLFFVAYTNLRSTLVIARFRVSSDRNLADAQSEVKLLEIAGYVDDHFSGQLQFGPDGYLYVSTGDGPSARALCSGQRLDSLRGKLLRLDVDSGATEPPYRAVPPTNPFAAGEAPEVWAYGLRNAWRFSFDRGTGDLYLGDVGENRREEIDRQPASSPGGENYGWARMEGSFCADLVKSCLDPVPPCGDPSLTPPILEHDHSGGFCAVIGGYVYRGSEIPELEGRYLYGDHCSGRVLVAHHGLGGWVSEELGAVLPHLSSFGEDATGEIYLTTATGALARLSKWPGRAVPGMCVPGESSLCLGGGRIWVAARWQDAKGRGGLAQAVPLTGESGYFWFFGPANVELVVKLLDGCAAGLATRWFFAAGLTDVAVDLRVLDTMTGAERRYVHSGGDPFPAIQDTRAFDCE
jgi:glucose/arabinose dehydrogenase